MESRSSFSEKKKERKEKKSGRRPSTRDQVLPFNVVFGQTVAVMAGLCSAVKRVGWHGESQTLLMFPHAKQTGSLLPSCVLALFRLVWTKSSTKAVPLMVQSVLWKNKTRFNTCRKWVSFSLCWTSNAEFSPPDLFCHEAYRELPSRHPLTSLMSFGFYSTLFTQ